MLKVEELIEHVAFKILISGVMRRALWKKLYALPNRSLLKVKQVMENHIQVEKEIVLCHGTPRFSRENLTRRYPKRDHFSRRNNNSRKSKNKMIRECMSYPEMHTTPFNVIILKSLWLSWKRVFSEPLSFKITTQYS